MRKILYLFLIGGVVFGLQSCLKEDQKSTELTNPTLPDTPYNYSNLNLPSGVFQAGAFINIDGGIFIEPGGDNIVSVTDDGATLGRVLFYDKNLSLNNTISCGSCHHQDKGFADGQVGSVGFEGKITERNSMGIINPISQNNLFWDSRSFSIVDLSLKPVQNHIEMGMEDLSYLKNKLSDIEYYPELFEKAFGTREITEEKISRAIAEFVGSITTSNSKFDYGLRTSFSNFSALEKMGMEIFNSAEAKCSTCHSGNNFAADDSPSGEYGGSFNLDQGPKGTTNIGLDLVYKDQGKNDGKFKIPSLRNIALTGPYMHDGRFGTLRDVIDHYSEGIKPHKDLDKKFKNASGDVVHLNLNDLEKDALVAFLHTLTDESLALDPKYSDPFKK